MIGCREREVHDYCLKSCGFFISNLRWDYIPDSDCSGVERQHCSIDAAPSRGSRLVAMQ